LIFVVVVVAVVFVVFVVVDVVLVEGYFGGIVCSTGGSATILE